MPHVTLLYPFYPRERFAEIAPLVEAACRGVEPFEVSLGAFRCFVHGRGRRSATLWLDPRPAKPIVALQRALLERFPDCDAVNRFEGGFTPHLSVGQIRGRGAAKRTIADLQGDWRPITFTVRLVALIHRLGDTPFRVDRAVALGRRRDG
jgi:2'-5' RNA ligase